MSEKQGVEGHIGLVSSSWASILKHNPLYVQAWWVKETLDVCRHGLKAIPSNCQATTNSPQHRSHFDSDSLYMCAGRRVATKAAKNISNLKVCMMPIINKPVTVSKQILGSGRTRRVEAQCCGRGAICDQVHPK